MSQIDHESASAADEEQEKRQEDDTQNAETTPGEKENENEVEDGVDDKKEDAGNKDKSSDNEDDKREATEDTAEKDDDKEVNEEGKDKVGVERDEVEDGKDDRPEEENMVDDGEKVEEGKDEEVAAQDGDSPEAQVETENTKEGEGEEHLPADGQTELQDDGPDQQEDKPDLSDEERTRLMPIFARKAVNDRLDLKGFKIMFRLLGEVVSSNEAEEMFKDDDKTIDFDEFCRLYAKFRLEEHDRKQAVLASIDKLFPGGDGESVELRKVEQLLLKLQQPDLDTRLCREKSDLGEDDIHQLVRAMDVDGSGRISRHEFVNALCQHIDM